MGQVAEEAQAILQAATPCEHRNTHSLMLPPSILIFFTFFLFRPFRLLTAVDIGETSSGAKVCLRTLTPDLLQLSSSMSEKQGRPMPGVSIQS
jgi:hypothetical protein